MATSKRSDGAALVPAARSGPVMADTPDLREWAEQLVACARAENVELTGDNGRLTAMVRQVLQMTGGCVVGFAYGYGAGPNDPSLYG